MDKVNLELRKYLNLKCQMEDIFRTYLIETINKRINVIDMYEEEEDKGFDIWEDLIKFFVISGYNEALYKGNVIEITLEGKPDVD